MRMVSLSDVEHSNSLVSASLPAGLVGLFVGGTSGIGEAALKKFAKHAKQPRIYFVGRSQEAADRILAECKQLNPEGEYTFIGSDVSLIHNVDEVCKTFTERENVLNLLFLSQGVMSMDRSETSEKIHLLAALNYYSRLRFITNLLLLMRASPSLKRVVVVGGGGKEGHLDISDFSAMRVPLPNLRPHLSSMITLGLEAVAKTAPDVSFIHGYPGTVVTGLYRDLPALPFDASIALPIDECGERQLFLATSAAFAPADGSRLGVNAPGTSAVAVGSTGKPGSGVYSIDEKSESLSREAVELLEELRREEVGEKLWQHTLLEFKRAVELY